MAIFKKFCFCMSLEVGSVVIGCLGILEGIVYTIVILMNFQSRLWPHGIEERKFPLQLIRYVIQTNLNFSIAAYNIDYLRVLLAIAQVVCSVQLVISVECQRSACTLPWLVVNFCDLVDRLVFLLSVTFGGKQTVEVDVREIALGILFMVLIFGKDSERSE